MKYMTPRPFADPAVAAWREIANATEALQDGRIHIEKINGRSCSRKAARLLVRCRAGLRHRQRLVMEA